MSKVPGTNSIPISPSKKPTSLLDFLKWLEGILPKQAAAAGVVAGAVLLGDGAYAKNKFYVVQVNKRLQMHESDLAKHDYYLNGGSSDGIKVGTTFVVHRRLPIHDNAGRTTVSDILVPVGEIKVSWTTEHASVAKINEVNFSPPVVLNYEGIMVGDEVEIGSIAGLDGTGEEVLKGEGPSGGSVGQGLKGAGDAGDLASKTSSELAGAKVDEQKRSEDPKTDTASKESGRAEASASASQSLAPKETSNLTKPVPQNLKAENPTAKEKPSVDGTTDKEKFTSSMLKKPTAMGEILPRTTASNGAPQAENEVKNAVETSPKSAQANGETAVITPR
ncbi:MAG: hypothetical protein COT74_10180 [Bdellovibrionales bacterium CG10_big_fil_rev_8_21_14_0_10_45_34]|nr:MAG: hypothetical protein COT74_10180 [Bdellovibrionales bacterium CG10_big_fil_rev_8_21_14_0_10_45_34]